jgi:hypothetical protein
MSHRCRSATLVALGALVSGGCATRDLSSGPTTEPAAGTWLAVGVAALLAAGVLGVLLVRPDRRAAGHGSRLAVAVLTLHDGGLAVGSAVLVGLAVRSGQLADRPPDAEMAVSLVRVGSIDGDGDLFALLVVALVVIGTLLTALVALAGRFSTGDDPVERWIATGVLVLELGVTAYAATLVVLGDGAVGWLVVALQLPIVVGALVAGWPTRSMRRASEAGSGYNGPHG